MPVRHHPRPCRGKSFRTVPHAAGTVVQQLEPRRLLSVDPAPAVVGVFVSGMGWSSGFVNALARQGTGEAAFGYRVDADRQMDALPWTNLNRASVRFSEHVNVAADDLTVRGASTATYAPAATGAFAYDPATFTATWTLATAGVPSDKLLLDLDGDPGTGVTDAAGNRLDGEWTTPAATSGGPVLSGNGLPGGDFHFRLNVLPGDANRDGNVQANDATLVRNAQGASAGNATYLVHADVNGSGNVQGNDVTLVRNQLGKTLPATEPAAPPAAPYGLTAVAASSSRVDLAWTDNSVNEAGFEIEQSADGTIWQRRSTVAAGVTAGAVTGLAASTAYHFRVRAVNATGNSAYSNTASTTTWAPPLFTEDFSSGADGFQAVDGTWSAAGGTYQVTIPRTAATGHLNTRSVHGTVLAGGGDFMIAVDASVATDSGWADFAVIFGYRDAGNYYFFSSNENNDAATSGLFRVVNGVSTELADVAAPIAPDAVYALRVERVGGILRAYRGGRLVATAADPNPGSGGRVGLGTRGDHATFDNLAVTGTPRPAPTAPPPAPAGLTAAAGASSRRVDLAWSAGGDPDDANAAAGFAVERSDDGGATWARVATVGEGVTSYAATGLAPATAYRFRVRASNAAGDSPYSGVAAATTAAAPLPGDRPGPDNTGPRDPAALVPSGPITVTTDGAVIENVDVAGRIIVRANNVTIRNFRVDAGGADHGVDYGPGRTGLVVEDGEVVNFAEAAIGVNYADYTARRLDVHDGQRDGFKAEGGVLVERCWVHRLGLLPGAHADGVQSSKGRGMTFRGNHFDLPHDAGLESTSAFMIKSDFDPIDDVLIAGNWLNGGQFTVYVLSGSSDGQAYPPPTNVRVLDNRFGRGAHYGLYYPGDATTVRQGNVWDDTGDPADE
jgi:hypothetical protein